MANDAKFNFYLNRQGARGQKGEKGDQGFSPSITVNTDTADEYTLLIQNEYDSFVTDNIRPTYDDRGGTYVRVDRANNVQYFGSADIATTANYGEVKLAQASDLASTVDVGNSNVITVELLKTWFGGQIADNLVTTTNNVTIQGQKIFATPTRFMDTVRIGNRLMVAQEDTGTITFDTDETGTLIGNHLTSTGDASFSKNVTVDGIATIEGGLNVAGNAVISSPQLGNTTISGGLTTKADINIQGQKVHLQHTNPTMYLKNMNGANEIEIFRGLFTAGNPSPADNYLNLGHSQLQLNLTGKAIKANGKDVATADTVEAMQSDLNIAKQDIIEAQGDIDNLQMNKQNKLTAGTGITIDADNVISATGGVVDLPIASSTTLGGIKVGENLTVSEDGTLSATGGGSGTSINDSTTSSASTWSSSKINSEINTVANEVVQIQGDVTNLSGKVTAVEGKTTDLENAVENKQNKLTAGQGISIVQKYANELEKVYYDSNGNVLSDVSNYEVKSGQRNNLFVYDNLNLNSKFEFSVRIPTSVLTSSTNQFAVNFSSTINNNINSTGIKILKSNAGLTYKMGLMARNSNWRTNSTRSYDSVPDYFDVTVTRADASTKNLHVKFQCPLDSSAYEFDWDDGTDYGEIFPLNSGGLHLAIYMGKGDPFFGDFSNINFSYASLGELKTIVSSTTPITYLTRAEYDALETKDTNTMYVITDEEGGGGSGVTYTAEAPLSISSDNVISIDTTDLGGTTLKKDASINVDYALDLTANGTVGGTSKAARAESNESKHDAYMAFSGHNPSDAISTLWGPSSRKANSWVELYVPEGIIPASAAWTYGSTGEILPAVELLASNDGRSYTSLGSVTGVSTVTASMTFNTTDSYKYLRFKFRDACVSSAWGKFGLTSLKVKSSEVATYTELFIGDNIDVTNGVMNVNIEKLDITGSCMPDYSAGKDASPNTIHTATVDGYVFAQAQSTSGGNGGHVDIYDKNGTLIKSWNYVGAEKTDTYGYSAFQCPIPKGYSYKVYGGVNIVIQFYPAKGTEV